MFKKILQVPFMFLLLNWAAVAGLYYYARGHQDFWDMTQKVKVPRVIRLRRA